MVIYFTISIWPEEFYCIERNEVFDAFAIEQKKNATPCLLHLMQFVIYLSIYLNIYFKMMYK